MTKLTTKEMLIALAEGKKVRATHWEPYEFIHIVNNVVRDYNTLKYDLCILDFDWEIYEEPVKPVKKYLYDYSLVNDAFVFRTTRYYASDDDFKEDHVRAIKFKRRDDDWTEL